MPAAQTLGFLVIAVTMVGVAVGRYPWLRMNRATIAVVGATVLVLLGEISLEGAYRAIDLNTLVLLFGMMVINANLRLAGFFGIVAARLPALAASPRLLLGITILAAGLLSALFLNDTIVFTFTPLVLEMTAAYGLPPVPFLIGLATAANVGSVATLIGNPQNMLIGISSGIPFTRFALRLGPVALGGLLLLWGILAWIYRAPLRHAQRPAPYRPRVRVLRPLLRKSLVATTILLAALIAGTPPPLAAVACASLLLVTRRLRAERVFREIDWSLLVFFAGLFVVTGAAEGSAWMQSAIRAVVPWAEGGVVGLAAVSALLSNLVSNVPAVLLLRPVVGALSDSEGGWFVLAAATTLAGNLTLLGSVANLIVAEIARRDRVRLSFLEYLKAGVPATLATLAWAVAWLALVG